MVAAAAFTIGSLSQKKQVNSEKGQKATGVWITFPLLLLWPQICNLYGVHCEKPEVCIGGSAKAKGNTKR